MAGKGWILKAVAAAAVSLGLGGAALMSGCSGGEEADDPIWGEWQLISTSRNDGAQTVTTKAPDDECRILSFKSSGVLTSTLFVKAGDSIWVELSAKPGQYISNGSLIYLNGEAGIMPYSVSGGKLTVTGCYYDDEDEKEYCTDVTFTKANLANIRKSLWTVYTPDTALVGEWAMKVDGGESGRDTYMTLDLADGGDFYGGVKYINTIYNDGYWGTNGVNKLVLVDDDDHKIYKELGYVIFGSGSNKTLMIEGDKWVLWENRDALKSRRDAKPLPQKGKSALPPILSLLLGK